MELTERIEKARFGCNRKDRLIEREKEQYFGLINRIERGRIRLTKRIKKVEIEAYSKKWI